jgi:O-antigen/teichoic acid export membrane protein
MTPSRLETARRRIGGDNPLLRNGYALVLNVGLTSGLGVTFWVIAAREYTVEDVGRGSAMVSALITLSTLGQLNLTSGLLRFLPRAGHHAARLIRRSYATATLASALLAAGFLLVAPHVSSRLSFLPDSPLLVTAFCGAVAVWSVFSLEDAAMTGLRRAVWVPVENSVYGVIKLLLLLLLEERAPGVGVFAAWVLAAAVVLPPVNAAIFRRWLPAHVRATPRDQEFLPGARDLARYLSVDYLGSACYLASTSALPLVVVSQLGAEANGYFYVAWTISSSLDLVSTSLAQSLLVEASHTPARLAEHLRSLLPRLVAILGVAVAVVLVAAPLLLRLYGGEYVESAVPVVRLLTLAVLPRAVLIVSIAVARVQRRVGRVLAIQASAAAVVLVSAVLLASPLGIAGVGLAWLIGQCVLAGVLLPSFVRLLRSTPGAGPEQADGPDPTSTGAAQPGGGSPF